MYQNVETSELRALLSSSSARDYRAVTFRYLIEKIGAKRDGNLIVHIMYIQPVPPYCMEHMYSVRYSRVLLRLTQTIIS